VIVGFQYLLLHCYQSKKKHFVVLISLLWLGSVNRNQVEALLSRAFTRKDGQNSTQMNNITKKKIMDSLQLFI
jgi:uncharacterized protein (UPF0332 family)